MSGDVATVPVCIIDMACRKKKEEETLKPSTIHWWIVSTYQSTFWRSREHPTLLLCLGINSTDPPWLHNSALDGDMEKRCGNLPDKCWRKVFLPSRCHRAAWRCWWSWRWWAASALSDQRKVPRACWASCLWFQPVPVESHPARSFGHHSLAGVSGLAEQQKHKKCTIKQNKKNCSIWGEFDRLKSQNCLSFYCFLKMKTHQNQQLIISRV